MLQKMICRQECEYYYFKFFAFEFIRNVLRFKLRQLILQIYVGNTEVVVTFVN